MTSPGRNLLQPRVCIDAWNHLVYKSNLHSCESSGLSLKEYPCLPQAKWLTPFTYISHHTHAYENVIFVSGSSFKLQSWRLLYPGCIWNGFIVISVGMRSLWQADKLQTKLKTTRLHSALECVKWLYIDHTLSTHLIHCNGRFPLNWKPYNQLKT